MAVIFWELSILRLDVFPNACIVFLFDETGVVFFMGTAAGKVDMLILTPFGDGFVAEFGTVIAVIFQKGKREGRSAIGQSSKVHFHALLSRPRRETQPE
jgi:hypothetical protein